MLEMLLLLQLAINGTQLAPFLDRIGRVNQLQSICLVHSSVATKPEFLDVLQFELHLEQNHFNLLPQIISTELSDWQFNSLTDQQTVFVILATNTTDPIIELHSERARDRRFCKTFFLLRQDEGARNLRTFFEYLWLKGFRSALVMVAKQRLYHMDPYPTLRVLQVSLTENERLIFPSTKRTDFMGYALRVPVQLDVPSTFWFASNDTGTRKLQLDGSGGTLIRELMQHLNVCLEVYPLIINGSNNINMDALVQLVAEHRIELSPHQSTTLQRSKKVDYSYPYAVVPRCFMLPLHAPFPHGLYVIKPFQPFVWLSLIMMVPIKILLRYLMRHCIWHFNLNLWSMLGVPGSQMGSNAHKLLYSPLYWPCRLLICVTLVFSAFIIVQLYVTKLTSLLTVLLTTNPRMTILEFLQLPYPIVVLPSDVDAILASYGNSSQVRRHFYFLNEIDFYNQRVEMQDGYIYPISTLRWKFLSMQQRYLKQKRFWLSPFCYGTFPNQFQLRIGSHFKEALHHFELHVQEAGLQDKWRSLYYSRAKQLGFVRDFANLEYYELMQKVRPLSLNLISSVFYLYLFGIFVALLAFLLEFVM